MDIRHYVNHNIFYFFHTCMNKKAIEKFLIILCKNTTINFIYFNLQEDLDWGFVAMVLDRLFLWIFAIVSVVGTILILCEAPSFCGEVNPEMDFKNPFISPQRNHPTDDSV